MNPDTIPTPMKWRRILNDEIIEKGDRRFSTVDPNLPPIAVEEWWIGKTAGDSNVHEFETTRPWPMHLEVGALRGKIEKLETELTEKTNEVARLRNENDELKLSEAALSEQLKISDDWLKQTRNEVARLRAELEALNTSGR